MSVEPLAFLDDLNPAQLTAVKENNVPLMINAGAGSGKTKVISSKIAYLLKEGIKPESILALTFTQKAADEMLSRVSQLLGNIHDLQISTFHSFCNQFLVDNLLETNLNSNFKTIPDTAQLVFFARNVNSFGLEYLQATNGLAALAEEVKKFISRCKDESISLDDLNGYLMNLDTNTHSEQDEELKNTLKDISKMFSAYENYKQQQNMVDFGDMLFIVYSILSKNKRLLERYQSKFQYILVDEFQDTNFVQLKILHLLSMKQRKICVVGDDDQSIYRFRGAYVTNIKEFQVLFPDHKAITLNENYRSTRNILDLANRVISHNPERVVKELRTTNETGNRAKVVECNTDIIQTLYVADRIQEIRNKDPLNEIAVLCRSRASGIPVAHELKKRQIPYEFIGTLDFFFKPIIKDLICLLKIIDNPVSANAEMIRTLERNVFSLKRTDVAKLSNLAHAKMCGAYEVFNHIDEINIDKDRFLAAKRSIDDLIDCKNKLNLNDLVYEILFNHNFYKHELQFNNPENISYLNTFYKFTEEFAYLYPNGELGDFISYIDFASEFDLDERNEGDEPIKILTVHAAKGKEFSHVFLIDATERRFPAIYRSDKFEIPSALLKGARSGYTEKDLHFQEERRLFYVAITRAKKQLTISYPKRYHNNTTESKPSRFLVDIEYNNNANIDLEIINKESSVETIGHVKDEVIEIMNEIIADLKTHKYTQAIEKVLLLAKIKSMDVHEILSHITEPDYVKLKEDLNKGLNHAQFINGEFEFSASQFNTYERCPRIYEYHYIYKIPSKPKGYFDFGGIVHKVIEELTNRIRNGETVDKIIALEILKRMWNPKGFESKLEEKQSLEEISEILENFLFDIRGGKGEILDLEKDFALQIEDYVIKGRIDRIDSDGNDYVIIDYKTSKEALGPKKAAEDVQLVLYSLAVENMYGKKPKLVGWWFLRKNKKVMVEISQEKIDKIKTKIVQIVTSIRNADFHPEPGWVCKNCDFKLICNEAKLH